MERAIEFLAVIHFFIFGMSHIVNAFLTLAVGSLIVAFHNVWTGIPALLTAIGWAQVIKSLIYFLAPSVGLKSLERVSLENAKKFIAPGVGLVAVSGLLVYHLLTS